MRLFSSPLWFPRVPASLLLLMGEESELESERESESEVDLGPRITIPEKIATRAKCREALKTNRLVAHVWKRNVTPSEREKIVESKSEDAADSGAGCL